MSPQRRPERSVCLAAFAAVAVAPSPSTPVRNSSVEAPDAQRPQFECYVSQRDWRLGWSEVKTRWCCEVENICKSRLEEPFDCTSGQLDWKTGWSPEKQQWCCDQKGICSTELTQAGMGELLDCAASLRDWERGWSKAKRAWCCDQKDVCLVAAPTEGVDVFDCWAALKEWKAGWSEAKKLWCCDKHQLCRAEAESAAEALYDCEASKLDWQAGWSEGKKDWCCREYGFCEAQFVETVRPDLCDSGPLPTRKQEVIFDLAAGYISQNNLGGDGPDSGAEELRFSNIAHAGEISIDLVITAAGEGTYQRAAEYQNCLLGELGKISLRNGVAASLRFAFVDASTGSPVVVDHFVITLLDLDSSWQEEVKEQVIASGFDDVYADSRPLYATKIAGGRTEFTSDAVGTDMDNPSDPSVMTLEQQRKSVALRYTRKDSFDLILSSTCMGSCPNGSGTGRDFLFSFKSSMVPLADTTPDLKEWCCDAKPVCPEPFFCDEEILRNHSDKFQDHAESWSDARKAWCCSVKKSCRSHQKRMDIVPYVCSASSRDQAEGWSVAKKKWCCHHENVCQLSEPDHDSSSLFDCEAGKEQWEAGWSMAKQLWCCDVREICPLQLNGNSTEEQNKTVDPFDCTEGIWERDLGWSEGKKIWCCEEKRVCSDRFLEITTAPRYNCKISRKDWKEGWSAAKKEWCCNSSYVCLQGVSEDTFDCEDLQWDWKDGLSIAKKAWCCDQMSLCPEARSANDSQLAQPMLEASCLSAGTVYMPIDMEGETVSLENSTVECQERCATTLHCAHFSFWKGSPGHCHLEDSQATRYSDPLFDSGLPSCDRDAEQQTCLEPGVLYFPAMHGATRFLDRSNMSFAQVVEACQRFCAETEGCAHFSLQLPEARCDLADSLASNRWPILAHELVSSQSEPDVLRSRPRHSRVISGPPRCHATGLRFQRKFGAGALVDLAERHSGLFGTVRVTAACGMLIALGAFLALQRRACGASHREHSHSLETAATYRYSPLALDELQSDCGH